MAADASSLSPGGPRAEASAARASGLGTWSLDVARGAFELSSLGRELLGVADELPLPVERLEEQLDPASRARLRSFLAEAACSLASHVDLRLAAERRIVRVRGGLAAERGVAPRVCGTLEDVTRQAEVAAAAARRMEALERSLAERSRALASAVEAHAAEVRRREEAHALLAQAEKLEVLGQLTGGVAHDFRNALQPIVLGYEILERTAHDVAARSIMERGRKAAQRAVALVNGLLAFARREASRPAALDPAALVRGLQGLMRSAVGARVTCTFDVEEGVWPVVAEAHRLEAALLNLALNARDAMPDGGALHVTVGNRPDAQPAPELRRGDWVVFAVQDSGSGMSPEVLARAAEPFFTTKGAEHGTGLGLAMVRSFAAESNGLLTMRSAPGQGTRMEIALPRSSVADAEAAALPGEAAGRRRQGKVLLVDDDDLVRQVAAACLRDEGYTVLEAEGGDAALALAHATERLDVLVCDVAMPRLDGPGLAARLRVDRPDLPVLYVTGEDARRALRDDEGVLPKPFTRAQLLGEVSRLLAARGDAGRAAELSDRLLTRIRGPALVERYLAWRGARALHALPDLTTVLEACRPGADTFLVEVDAAASPVAFRFVSVGDALVARLGRPLAGTSTAPAGDDLAGSVERAYERSVRTRLPSYDYALFRLPDGPSVRFERLILPASRDGERITHLFGVVEFRDVVPEEASP